MDTPATSEIVCKHLDHGNEYEALVLFLEQAFALQKRSESFGKTAETIHAGKCLDAPQVGQFLRFVQCGDVKRSMAFLDANRVDLFSSAGEIMSAIFGSVMPEVWPRNSNNDQLMARSILFSDVRSMMLPSEYFSTASDLY